MKKVNMDIESNREKKFYESPVFLTTVLDLEEGIAAASVQTGMQQEHNEENQSFDVEW
ncbi:hypothetical protein [Sphingobacterium anhuiense]|uniref:hypothetical protein n=1 Tax=Sphingobacterium anhuiense TaxID=493780 RepID=UPI003C2FD6B3